MSLPPPLFFTDYYFILVYFCDASLSPVVCWPCPPPHAGGAFGDLEVQGRGFDGLGEWAERSVRQSLDGRHRPTGFIFIYMASL